MNKLAEVLNHSIVRQLLAEIGRDWMAIVDRAIEIQQLPSPTFKEEVRARHVQKLFHERALANVERDALHNVYGRIPGRSASSPTVVTAHLDTVFGLDTDLTVRRQNGRIYGPGIADNSLGVSGLVVLADYLTRAGLSLQNDIWLVANVGEEGLGNLRGMKMVTERFGPNACYIVVEGGIFGHIFHGGIAVRRFEVTIKANGGHSWGDFGRQSAIHALGRIITRVTRMPVPHKPKTTFNVGLVEGGTSVNTIAQHARMLVDLRSEETATLDALAESFQTIVRDLTRHRELEATITMVGDRPAGFLPREAPLVALASEVLSYLGCSQIRYEVGSTDANIPLSRGWPCVCIGLTRSANAHRLDEYMEIEPLSTGFSQLFLLTLATAGLRG